MKTLALWLMVILWFVHLAVGAGAGWAALRLWPERRNQFVRVTMIHLHACIIDALMAIVLLFLAKDVVLTWKFSIAWFVFTIARDVVRLPLILFVLKGPSESSEPQRVPRSGEMPPDFWSKDFRQAIRDTIKPEFLK